MADASPSTAPATQIQPRPWLKSARFLRRKLPDGLCPQEEEQDRAAADGRGRACALPSTPTPSTLEGSRGDTPPPRTSAARSQSAPQDVAGGTAPRPSRLLRHAPATPPPRGTRECCASALWFLPAWLPDCPSVSPPAALGGPRSGARPRACLSLSSLQVPAPRVRTEDAERRQEWPGCGLQGCGGPEVNRPLRGLPVKPSGSGAAPGTRTEVRDELSPGPEASPLPSGAWFLELGGPGCAPPPRDPHAVVGPIPPTAVRSARGVGGS